MTPPPEGVLTNSVFGTDITCDNDLALAIWADFLPQALEKGVVVPKPDPVIAGRGLVEIQKGRDTLRKGVNAQKVVVVSE